MRLILVRHGEATSKDEDPQRPLTASGAEMVQKVASFLGRSGALSVKEIRHSTKLRARQTAELIAEESASSGALKEVAGLEPLADVSEITGELMSAEGDLMLVGHLPHLERLAANLVTGRADADGFAFAECGVLCLQRHDSDDGVTWRVEWMLDPRLISD